MCNTGAGPPISSRRSPPCIFSREAICWHSPQGEETSMSSSTIEPLILDLVEWVAREPRAYADVMEAWRTSCPRLTVWEDAVDRGLVRREAREGTGLMVLATAE